MDLLREYFLPSGKRIMANRKYPPSKNRKKNTKTSPSKQISNIKEKISIFLQEGNSQNDFQTINKKMKDSKLEFEQSIKSIKEASDLLYIGLPSRTNSQDSTQRSNESKTSVIDENKNDKKTIVINSLNQKKEGNVKIYGLRDPRKEFFPLSSHQLKCYKKVFNGGRRNEVLVNHYNVKMTRDLMMCLRNGSWLNDEVINFYFKLVKDRYERHPDIYPNMHIFSSFFYFKLVVQRRKFSHQNVRTWTRKFDLFSFDKICAPIHLTNHWALGVINLRDKRFEYYDSIYSHYRGREVLGYLRRYLEEESIDKRKIEIDTSDWEFYIPRCPQQNNCFDCGMFTCKAVNCVSQDMELTYGQKDMSYFRKRMCWEILNIFVP